MPGASVSKTASTTFTTTPYSITNAAIGAADATRIVIIGIGAQGGTDTAVSSVTIGGNAATQIVNSGTQAGSQTAAFYALAVPAGTTATCSASFTGTAPNFGGMGVWSLIGGRLPALNTGTDNTNPLALTANIVAGAVALGISKNANAGAATPTWSGLAQDFSSSANTNNVISGASAAFANAAASQLLQCSWSASGAGTIGVFAVFPAISLPVFQRPTRFFTRNF